MKMELIITVIGVVVLFIYNKIMGFLLTYQAEGVLKYIEECIEIIVINLQPIAEQFKKDTEDGKLTEIEKQQLKELALQKIDETVPLIKKYIIEKILGKEMLNDFINKTIEKFVLKSKTK